MDLGPVSRSGEEEEGGDLGAQGGVWSSGVRAAAKELRWDWGGGGGGATGDTALCNSVNPVFPGVGEGFPPVG